MRQLMVASGVGKAHAARLLLIARALRSQGHEVTFANGGDDRLAAADSFQTFELPEAVVSDFGENVYAAYTRELVERCVREERAVIQATRPDVVVGDFRPTAAISARLEQVPYAAILNGYMTSAFDPTDVLLAPATTRGKRAFASFVSRGVQAAQKRDLASTFREVAKRHGLAGLTSLGDFLEGDLTLIADLPEFCPLRNLPESQRYVGPLVWEPAADASELQAELDPTRPLIYATTGNTGPRHLVDLVVDAFGRDERYEVVLTTGAYNDPPADSRPNVHVTRYAPASEILRRAVAVVHCGGSGTTYQALREGVPAVVVPENNDQRINAHLVKRHGLGMALVLEQTTGDVLRAAVELVVADAELRPRLLRFQELMSRARGPEAAADEIVGFAGR